MSTTETIEARALRREIERVTRRLRSSLNAMRAELDRVDDGIADNTATSNARQVVSIAADIAQDTARLEALNQYGNLVPAEVSTP